MRKVKISMLANLWILLMGLMSDAVVSFSLKLDFNVDDSLTLCYFSSLADKIR